MYANRSEMAQTSGEATNVRFRSAEGIYKAKAKPGFDSESPVSTDLFAYICVKILLLPFGICSTRLEH
jgi:hypothetical protein